MSSGCGTAFQLSYKALGRLLPLGLFPHRYREASQISSKLAMNDIL